ncbi:hypothetical protein EZV73_06135 [Acidaminobacter sp. JC074]|uniref:hypothetical protein n=1 Tax=Acidaminobacter sp. JC074 TaxID=2530199 RepID=UPI001F0FD507|nr:hypothetical protein [Acidaminobacter sp. JC074]MCH4887139.1 hypothetical protein [Acidaminobacter sp. JC074]
MFYNYPIHYLYDLLAMGVILFLGKQLFNLTVTKKQMGLFIGWMMLCYQINFYLVVPYLQRELKYIVLYLGLYIGFRYIIKLKTVGSLIVITTTSALNGIFTNINLYFMLVFLFPNYGVALEAQHLQYTCYIVSIVLLSILTKVLNLQIFDLEKYV